MEPTKPEHFKPEQSKTEHFKGGPLKSGACVGASNADAPKGRRVEAPKAPKTGYWSTLLF